jgi:hypothetical protein
MRRRAALIVASAASAAVVATALAAASPGPSSGTRAGDGTAVIIVRGTKCPKSHPHKVGSSSAASWTRIDGGRIVHRSRRSSICAR